MKPSAVTPQVSGHVDHLWQLGPGRYLVAGWCSEPGPEASLRWMHAPVDPINVALGPVRLRRPDVAAELGLTAALADFGFLVAVEVACAPGPVAIQVGINRFSLVPQQLLAADPNAALLQLLDACHWAFTPPERLPQLLESGLGQGLRWLLAPIQNYGLDGPSTENSEPPVGSGIQMLLELNDDHQLARCRLWQLQHQAAVQTGTLPVLLQPSRYSQWGAARAVPAWLQRLLAMVQLDLPVCFGPSPLRNCWVLRVGAQAPPALLGMSLTPLLETCLHLVAKPQSGPAGFRDLPGVTFLRAVDLRQPRGRVPKMLHPSPWPPLAAVGSVAAHASRSSWLRGVEHWLERED